MTTAQDTSTPSSTATDVPGRGAAAEVLEVTSPLTGDVVGTYPVHGRQQVEAAVATAHEWAEWWRTIGYAGRRDVLDKWRAILARRIAQLADVVHQETGKPHPDAMIEAALAVDHLAWAARHAEKVLGRRKVSSGLLMANQAASVEYLPLGVIGVIGPWNYPVFTPMGSIAYALAAGNAVVYKPSELTPGVGVWLAETLAEVVPGQGLLQVVTGYGETGEALCRADVDKVAFTGSPATGRKIMATCAERLTPVLIEAGGKDPMIVADDADVTAAADAAAWGAFSNAGQTCAGVERVYVHEQVYDEFLAELTRRARELYAGADPGAKIGPMTLAGQVDVARRHIEDALARGGRAVVGGPEAVEGRFIQPTVLVDVPEDSLAITEETFAPTVTVTKVKDLDEAVERANSTHYGLGSTVFSKSKGLELAERIRSGMTAINGVISFAGIPELPFGGIGESGFGRIHGPDGLKEFTYAKAIARQRMKPALALTTFDRTEKADRALGTLVAALYGGVTQLPRLGKKSPRP
jgi:acyl-CoA reductase-like NAD-dependent aldehyde dehydrogenase